MVMRWLERVRRHPHRKGQAPIHNRAAYVERGLPGLSAPVEQVYLPTGQGVERGPPGCSRQIGLAGPCASTNPSLVVSSRSRSLER
jgi:hypothetical protein